VTLTFSPGAPVRSGRVDWRNIANRGLYRTTGYKLMNPDRLPAPAPPPPPPPPPKPQGRLARQMPGYYEDDVKAIVRTVRKRTMTAHEKLNALVLATRYVVDHDIPGALVECGVWRGGSMQAMALALNGRGVTDRELHLYDTFEGMTAPTEEDKALDGTPAAQLLASKPRDARIWAVADLEDVRTGMAETGYPPERIHYHVGPVEQTLPEQAPEQVAVLRLDTDWYESTRHELEHLYARLPPGGVLILDDYSTWQGARKAVDEFFAALGEPLLLVPIAAGRIAVKPA
jgi:O-methyltransferase